MRLNANFLKQTETCRYYIFVTAVKYNINKKNKIRESKEQNEQKSHKITPSVSSESHWQPIGRQVCSNSLSVDRLSPPTRTKGITGADSWAPKALTCSKGPARSCAKDPSLSGSRRLSSLPSFTGPIPLSPPPLIILVPFTGPFACSRARGPERSRGP